MKKQFSILKTIKGKPSVALKHMVTGLLKQSRRRNFEIAMSVFGIANDKTCFGCAATCAVQNIANKNYPPASINHICDRSDYLNIIQEELKKFERAINCARLGELEPLFDFCGINDINVSKFETNFHLCDDDWKKQIPTVKETIAALKKAGY